MAIEPQTITFIGFAPDLDSNDPGVIADCSAVLPTGKGFFRPQPSFVNFGSALPAQAFGAIEAQYLNGTIRYFAGTATHLYEETGGAGGSWAAVDGGSTFGAGTLPGGGWRFTVFGNACIAVDGSSSDAPRAAGAAGNFATITPPMGMDAMPNAAVVASIANNFVMIGNVTNSTDGAFPNSGDRWWTCAQGDYTNWSPSVSTLSATGRLLDTQGPITAIKSLGSNITAAIYKQQATYLALFVGAPIIWQFIRVSSLVGAFSQESVVDIGNVHVFPSFDDFWSFDGNSVSRIPNPIRDYFYGKLNLNAVQAGTSNILGSYDRLRDVVYWYFPSTTTAIDSWVAWNIRSNQWTKGSVTTECLMLPEVNLTPPAQGVFNTSHTLQTISGASNPAAFLTTTDLGDHNHFWHVTRLRPRWFTFPTASPASVTCTGFGKLNLGDGSTTLSGPVPMSPYGWINFRQNARWNSFKFIFGQDCEIQGFDLYQVPAGDR